MQDQLERIRIDQGSNIFVPIPKSVDTPPDFFFI
jgi:hypothetical protein